MDTSYKVLVVDDDIRILDLIKQFLVKHGYEVDTAIDVEDAKIKMHNTNYDLMILDVMLPKVTGIEFATEIKQHTQKLPIILLTALNDAEQRVIGLEAGADDYVGKPFEPKELLLRIKKLIELYQSAHTSEKEDPRSKYTVKFGKILYNTYTHCLIYNADGEANEEVLTSTESRLLNYLIEHKGEVVTRQEIAQVMLGINERSIDVQITRLRQRLEENPKKPSFIRTVRHGGYMLVI